MQLFRNLAGFPFGGNLTGVRLAGGGGGVLLPFSDAFTRADGAIGNDWTGTTWTVSGNKAVNTPTLLSEIVVNGGFDADTNWTKGSGWSIGSGVASATAVGSTLSQSASLANGCYQSQFDVVTISTGSFNGRVGGQTLAGRATTGTAVGTGFVNSITALDISGFSAPTGTVDNVSVKAVTLASLFATRNFGVSDVDASVATTVVARTQAGVALNVDSTTAPASFVIGYHDNNARVYLVKCVNGTYTTLINAVASYVAGAVVRVTKSGTTYKLFYNGVQAGTDQTITDNSIVNNTLHGMFSTYSGNNVDNFSISAVV